MHTGVVPRLTVHTGVVPRLSVHTGVVPRLSVHTGIVPRLLVYTGVVPRLSLASVLDCHKHLMPLDPEEYIILLGDGIEWLEQFFGKRTFSCFT